MMSSKDKNSFFPGIDFNGDGQVDIFESGLFFHMMQEEEGPQSILNAGYKYLRHVHIAEKTNRTPPGVDGDDFTPYFQALKKIKYQGNISIECGWSDFKSQVGPAIREVKRQLESVYR